MKDNGDLYEVLERGEDAMFQQVIDEVEGQLGLAESENRMERPTEKEYTQWKTQLDKLARARGKPFINRRWLQRTAFVAAVLILLFSLTAAALKLQLFNFVEVTRERFTQIQPIDLAESRVAEWTDVYLPSYLPDGFFVSDAFESGDAKIIEYADLEGARIIFYQYGPGSGIRLDSEDADKQMCQIGGQDAWILQKNTRCILYWYDNTCAFSLEYSMETVSELEITQMAESLIYQNE